MGIVDLLNILREAASRGPTKTIKLAYGLLAVAAVAAIIILMLGATRATIIIIAITFIGGLIVALASVGLDRDIIPILAAKTLIWAISIFFICFLFFTITAFSPLCWPCPWVTFLGVPYCSCSISPPPPPPPPPPPTVKIERKADFSKTGCYNHKPIRKAVYTDILTFSHPVKFYFAQGHSFGKGHQFQVEYFDDENKPITPIIENQTEQNEKNIGRAKIPVNGKELVIKYTFEEKDVSDYNRGGISVVSSLPILGFTASIILPPGKIISSIDHSNELSKGWPEGCGISGLGGGNLLTLKCEEPLNNQINIPQNLIWEWDVWSDCQY